MQSSNNSSSIDQEKKIYEARKQANLVFQITAKYIAIEPLKSLLL